MVAEAGMGEDGVGRIRAPFVVGAGGSVAIRTVSISKTTKLMLVRDAPASMDSKQTPGVLLG